MADKTNSDIKQLCLDHHDYEYADRFDNNTAMVDVDIYKGGLYLGCMFGAAGLYVWAIGLLAAGQSSTMAGCYAGQFVMEDFLNIRWARWKRVLFTRSVAIVPTLLVAVFQDIQHLTSMNDLLNAMQMIQLPFALIPCLTLTCSERVMKDFKNGIFFRIFLSIVVVGAIIINLIFVFQYINNIAGDKYWAWAIAGVVMVFYFCFIFYLTIYCVAALLSVEDRLQCRIIKTLFPMKENMHLDSPWLANESINRVDSTIAMLPTNPTGIDWVATSADSKYSPYAIHRRSHESSPDMNYIQTERGTFVKC